MPRIRSIHPGQWTDDAFVECSDGARLLALGIRNFADDNGVFEWNPRKLKMWIFPGDNRDIEPLLSELLKQRVVRQFEHKGKVFGHIRNFGKYQRIRKPTFQYPAPEPEPDYPLNAEYHDGDDHTHRAEHVEIDDASPEPVRHHDGNSSSEVGGMRYEGKEEPRKRADPKDNSQNQKRGSRLADDWVLPTEWRQWAEGRRPDLHIPTVAELFHNHWTAKAGKDAAKLNWYKTWQTWVIKERAPPASRQRANDGTLTPSTEPWEMRVKNYQEKPSSWRENHWGPPPGQPGCQVPPEFLGSEAP